MKLTLDVENTVTTKRDGKLHLDPFEPRQLIDYGGYA